MKQVKNLAELDLHGVSYEDVSWKCHKFINNNWASKKEGHIITGNSIGMKALVFDVLKQYQIDFEESKRHNTGYIKVWFD